MVDSRRRKSKTEGSVENSGTGAKGDSRSGNFLAKIFTKGKNYNAKDAAKSAIRGVAKGVDSILWCFEFSTLPLSSNSSMKADQEGRFVNFMSRFFPRTFTERHYGLKITKGTEKSGIYLSSSNLSNNRDISIGIPSYKFSYKDLQRFYNWKGEGSKSNSLYYDEKFKGFMSLVALDNKLIKDYGSGVSIQRKGLEYKVVIEIDVTNKSIEELEEIVRTISTDFLDIRDTKFIKTAADRLYRGVSLNLSDLSKNIADNSESNGLECVDKKEDKQRRSIGKELIEPKNGIIDSGEEEIDTRVSSIDRGEEYINDVLSDASRGLHENTVSGEEDIDHDFNKIVQRVLRDKRGGSANRLMNKDNDLVSRTR